MASHNVLDRHQEQYHMHLGVQSETLKSIEYKTLHRYSVTIWKRGNRRYLDQQREVTGKFPRMTIFGQYFSNGGTRRNTIPSSTSSLALVKKKKKPAKMPSNLTKFYCVEDVPLWKNAVKTGKSRQQYGLCSELLIIEWTDDFHLFHTVLIGWSCL